MQDTKSAQIHGIKSWSFIDTRSSMPISPSKSRDLADENNKILTEWKWFETTVLKRIRRNLLGVDIVQIFVIMNSCIFISCKNFFKIKFVFFLYLRLSASSMENDLPLCIYFWYRTDSGVPNTSTYSAVSLASPYYNYL
jgi:hypothetical protein